MSQRGWVLVTGASTGIGRATVERLAADGWSVVAGVRKDGDAPPAATRHVLIDVADPDSVAAGTAEVIEMSGGRLSGLVNNAGISLAGPFEALSVEDYRRQFDVNFFGHLDVTGRLLSSLLAAGGRIVTVGSVGGRISTPFLSAYNASKFAIRGWNDALRSELAPHGVKVILIEPGAIATEIWGKGTTWADTVLERLSPEQVRRYSRQIAGVRRTAEMVERNAIPASKAAAVVARALTASRPRAHVLVGRDAQGQALIGNLPPSVTDRLLATVMRPPKGSA